MMNAPLLSILLLATLLPGHSIPSNLWSCNRKLLKERDCHGVAGGAEMRAIESLRGHFWKGDQCDTVCYCNRREMLCCPRDVYLGQISFMIPCQKTFGGHHSGDPAATQQR